MLRAELKETFLRKLTRPERLFFLHKAREAIVQKEYRPGEDLFWYAYEKRLEQDKRPSSGHAGEEFRYYLSE
jgi:hypothetical protein